MTKKVLVSGCYDILHSGHVAWKISGAGGGGYLVLVSDHPIKNGIQIKIRR